MASTEQDIDVEREPTAATAESETGLDENIAGVLAYLFSFISGLIFFLIEKDNRFVRWHAAQSMAFSVLLSVAYTVLFIVQIVVTAFTFSGSTAGFILGSIIGLLLVLVWLALALGGFVTWIYLMIKAYQGETTRLPIAAGIADKLA